ncbi:MAG TPA: response regulator [Acidobacteriaceae bacterium]|nr:response regulator [Acidobacteriaceae bacterium]
MDLSVILNVGSDATLLDTRRMILQAAGYIVESANSIDEAIERFRLGDFDLVLLCHSLSERDRRRLISLIRASGSGTPVVAVGYGPGQYSDGLADATLDSGPRDLISGVRNVLLRAAETSRLHVIPTGAIPAGDK